MPQEADTDEVPSAFARAVTEGLSQPRKSLPCRFFYDAEGSRLFEAITELPEYYPTRTEASILKSCASEIAARTPQESVLVEFGSGSSRKTEILLAALPSLAAYVPLDVSPSALAEAAARLAVRFAGLQVLPVEGDFRHKLTLPAALSLRPRLGFFPGSTIGNLDRAEATELLRNFAHNLGPAGRLVIGVDLRKDPKILRAAYNDAAGVTAKFNLNLLVRANRELAATFDLSRFAHDAIFNEAENRIEMHLVSLVAQDVAVCGQTFHFNEGERIHTENSHKYSVADFHALAKQTGWIPQRVWCDEKQLFSVHELAVAT